MPKKSECPNCGKSTLHVKETLDGKVKYCPNCGYSSRPDSKSGQGFYESMGVEREEGSDSEDENGQDES
jgi:ribosomal protein S27AE